MLLYIPVCTLLGAVSSIGSNPPVANVPERVDGLHVHYVDVTRYGIQHHPVVLSTRYPVARYANRLELCCRGTWKDTLIRRCAIPGTSPTTFSWWMCLTISTACWVLCDILINITLDAKHQIYCRYVGIPGSMRAAINTRCVLCRQQASRGGGA